MKNLVQAAVTSVTLLCAFAAHAASYRGVYAFAGGSDASNPTNALLHIGNQFIGTTCRGGANGSGAIYTVTPGGKEQVIYSFGAPADGICPSSALLEVGNSLYGTTLYGGAHNSGTVFVMKILAGKIGAPSSIHYFGDTDTDGRYPTGGLTLFNNIIYGTTLNGGRPGHYCVSCGTVFFITQHNHVGTLYSFQGEPDGALPSTTLLPVGNLLFGTTQAGGADGWTCNVIDSGVVYGASGCGTVFSITPRGEEKVVYAFQGGDTDGYLPNGTLVRDGVQLYGTTQYGATPEISDLCGQNALPDGCGSVFAVTTAGTERILHTFSSGDGNGAWPQSGLTLFNGALYGSTSLVEPAGDIGTKPVIFSITPIGKFTVLYRFTKVGPVAPLTAFGNSLWGTTEYGGVYNPPCDSNCGTIFELKP